jgi:hypothetical protein
MLVAAQSLVADLQALAHGKAEIKAPRLANLYPARSHPFAIIR